MNTVSHHSYFALAAGCVGFLSLSLINEWSYNLWRNPTTRLCTKLAIYLQDVWCLSLGIWTIQNRTKIVICSTNDSNHVYRLLLTSFSAVWIWFHKSMLLSRTHICSVWVKMDHEKAFIRNLLWELRKALPPWNV